MWATLLVCSAVAYTPKHVDLTKLDEAIKEENKKIAVMEQGIKAAKEHEQESLLQTGSRPTWTSQDSAETEHVLADSYKNLDKVQNDILKAADLELQKQKSLPTLEQATMKWDASKFTVPSSFVETKAEAKSPSVEQEYEKTIDFSQLDKLRQQVDAADSKMATDFEAIKAQGDKDRAVAAELAPKAASLTEKNYIPGFVSSGKQGPDEMRPIQIDEDMTHAVDADEYARILESGHPATDEPSKAAPHAPAPNSFGETVPKLDRAVQNLDKVSGNLAALEEGMAKKEQQTGHATPQEEYLREKLRSLLMLSASARGLVSGASSGQFTDPQAELAKFRKMKEALVGLKAELATHFKHVSNVPHPSMSLVEKSPTASADGGYAAIEQNLHSLHDRIESQVSALNSKAKAATNAEVNALGALGPKDSEQYKFAWQAPEAGSNQVDDANMRGSLGQ